MDIQLKPLLEIVCDKRIMIYCTLSSIGSIRVYVGTVRGLLKEGVINVEINDEEEIAVPLEDFDSVDALYTEDGFIAIETTLLEY